MSDIVDQLAFVIKYGKLHAIPQEVVSKAAAEITHLRAENERLRSLVREAYDEGFSEADGGGWFSAPVKPWETWKKSVSCAKLREASNE